MTSRKKSCRASASRLAVGSSSTYSDASTASARAMSSFWRMPPERSRSRRVAISSRSRCMARAVAAMRAGSMRRTCASPTRSRTGTAMRGATCGT
ncbi:MAG: hypothetical protein U0802_13905 [Candidatus Binatia bacterium]